MDQVLRDAGVSAGVGGGADDGGDASGGDVRGFVPPTAEQWGAYLRKHDVGGSGGGRGLWAKLPLVFLVGLGVLGLLLFVSGDRGVLLVLPWVALVGLMVWGAWRGRRMRALSAEVRAMQDLGVLRDWGGALAVGWRLLPRVRDQPGVWARVVAMMGQGLAEMGAWGAAMVSVETLLQRLPGDHPAGAGLRVSRAVLALRLDRLGDADEELRRVRAMVDAFGGVGSQGGGAGGASQATALRAEERERLVAGYAYAGLVQDVVTHHFAEAVERGDGLVDRLRPMGMEAGYGYGLMAWCHWKLGDEAGARRWWTRAVLLVPGEALVARYGALKEVAGVALMEWKEAVAGVDGGGVPARATALRESAGENGGLGVFEWARFERDLRRDDRLRGVLIGGTLGLVGVALVLDVGGWGVAAVLPVLGLVAWGVLASWSARVSRRLPVVAELIERDTALAERELAGLLERRLVVRGLRLGVVRWWAVLRFRQERWEEASAVCGAVLRRLGQNKLAQSKGKRRGTATLRGPLGLILAESRLELGDLWGAYWALEGLRGQRLTLMEALRRTALVSRYEVESGRGLGEALGDRVRYAEVLPGRTCGAVHAVLAEAARQAGDQKMAGWLGARVVLLGGGVR